MIVELEKYRGELAAIKERLLEVGDGLHIGQMEQELLELREEMNAPGFWDDLTGHGQSTSTLPPSKRRSGIITVCGRCVMTSRS